jgi:signal transduction histidine kinase/CheY-like chemotaxis protein
MRQRVVTIAVERETDIVLVRQRTRRIAEQIGFDRQDQTRITTAVSEIVRNALDYGGGGRVEFWFGADGQHQGLEIIVMDSGPGIADIAAVLDGSYRSTTGMGLGVTGARRLMDAFSIETAPGKGSTVRMVKDLPQRARTVGKGDLSRIAHALAKDEQLDPNQEIRLQNREMLAQLEELQKRQQELIQLNHELHDTNRGVVALYAELDERADHLRRADELKSRFLSNMSHEFRTPLNSILALSRLLLTRKDGELTAEQEKQVQFVRKAAENLAELVNDLLDLAKVESGKTMVTPVAFTISDLFGALRGMLRPLLVGDVLSLVFEDASDLPPMITDEGKVSQILRNFMSNAIKFTEHGEVRVWAEHGRDADLVTFRVRDTGIGIAEQDLEIIWQEFGQINHRLQSRIKGTGLGLPLSKKLAELLGGSVAVESAPGEGSLFSLTLPRVYPQPIEVEGGEPEWRLEDGRMPVLVVEDNAADAFAYERALAGSRYQALSARSLAQAKVALERFSPVAILLDLILVGEEAWRFLIELKQNETTHRIPVIVVSSSQEERKARSLGADDYLSKPVEGVGIICAIDRATGHQSVTRVLVVDDDEVSRYLVRQLLPRGSYEISEAATGQDALERAAQQRPDVVLVDLNIPVMSGFEFLERWSATQGAQAAPAIVLTSMALSPEQQQRLAIASRIVPKSELSADALLSAIESVIGVAGEQRS